MLKYRVLVYWFLSFSIFRAMRNLYGVLTRFVVSLASGERHYRGIHLIAYPPLQLDSLDQVVNALELIRQTDPRRFARIEKHIKHIVLAFWSGGIVGRYKALGKICHLRKLPELEHSSHLIEWTYACVIVHEATHGVLSCKRYPYTKRNKLRLERVCTKEEGRFGAKIPGMRRELDAFSAYLKLCGREYGQQQPTDARRASASAR